MFDELKTKCNAMIADLEAAKAECTEGSAIKGVTYGELLTYLNWASRELNHVVSTIETYFE